MSGPTISQALESLPVVFTGGAGIGAGAFFFLKLFEWLGVRVDKNREFIDKGTQGLIKHLQNEVSILKDQAIADRKRFEEVEETWRKRFDKIEKELSECRKRDAEKTEELARLRGAIQGMGDAKREAASVIALNRLKDKGLLND